MPGTELRLRVGRGQVGRSPSLGDGQPRGAADTRAGQGVPVGVRGPPACWDAGLSGKGLQTDVPSVSSTEG